MANTRPLYTDPLRSFKFNAVIPQVLANANAAGEARFGFMSVSGLGISIEPLTYREGGDNLTALPLDAPVLTVDGWKRMGEIEVGDRVIDPRGEESKVVGLLPIVHKDTYQVTLGDGSSAEACWGHLWEVEVVDSNHNRCTSVMSTLELKALVDQKFPGGASKFKVLAPRMLPMNFDASYDLPLDPWLLGLLLSEGDLSGDSIGFATADQEVLDRVISMLPDGHHVWTDTVNPSKHRIVVDDTVPGARNRIGRNLLKEAVRSLGLLGKHAWDKEIPEPYKWATIDERLALLQGIMDGDGWVDRGGCTQFSSSSKALASGVRDLIRSLGGRVGPLHHETDCTYTYKGQETPCRDKYSFSGVSDLTCVPFTLARKVERFRCSPKTSTQFRRIRSVEFVGTKDVRCIEVSASSHLFISHDYVPSHNTRKMPGQADFNPITMSRGQFSTDYDNWFWMTNLFTAMYGSGVNPIIGAVPSNDFRTVVYINLLDHPNNQTQNTTSLYGVTYPNQANIVRVSWKLYSAWIGTLAYSDLDAGGNAVAVEQMTLNYEGFDMLWGGQFASGFVENPTSW